MYIMIVFNLLKTLVNHIAITRLMLVRLIFIPVNQRQMSNESTENKSQPVQ